jgi:Na+/phosphate symporter
LGKSIMPWRLVVDILGFQSTWWACALGAGAGRWEPGVAVGAAVAAGQLAASGERRAILITMLAAAAMGILAESALVAAGLVQYAAPWPIPGLAPAWLIVLWVVFATCIPATDRMLGKHALAKAAVIGAVVAPPTYWAGEGLGALTLAPPSWHALAAFAIVWAIATPAMLAVYRRTAAQSA